MNEGLKERELQLQLLLLHSGGLNVMAVYLMNRGTSGLLTQAEDIYTYHAYIFVNMVKLLLDSMKKSLRTHCYKFISFLLEKYF